MQPRISPQSKNVLVEGNFIVKAVSFKHHPYTHLSMVFYN